MNEDRLAQALEELFYIMSDPDLETHDQVDTAIQVWSDKYPDYKYLITQVSDETAGQ